MVSQIIETICGYWKGERLFELINEACKERRCCETVKPDDADVRQHSC